MILLSTLLLSMFITIALVPFFSGLAVKINVLDVPNDRKVHKYPMPKTGGIAMALGAFIPVGSPWHWGHLSQFFCGYPLTILQEPQS
jgi:UDP-GlcNAc:undecaprenyl-phosphate GlcNAc-1-phosphate transferase